MCEFSERFKSNRSADNMQKFASGNERNNNKQLHYLNHSSFNSVCQSFTQNQVKHLR